MLSRIRRSALLVPSLSLILLLLWPSAGFSQALPKVTADRIKLLQKLVNHQFDRLDAELSSDEKQAEQDPRSEMNAMVAFAAFDTSQPLTASRLDDWVKAAPDSYSAALARATCLLAIGSKLQGAGPAKGLPESFRTLPDKYFREAKQEADRALAINRNLGLAYALRIKLARLRGDDLELKGAKGEALAAVPASFAVREQIMYASRPRWGGTREAMQQFANSSQYYVPDNPAIQFLKAWVALDAGDDFADRHQWQEAADSYTRALELGGEYWIAYRRRANAFYAMNRWEEALRDATRANELFPHNSETLKLLANTTAQLHQPDASILWVAEYLRFEVPEPEMMALFKTEEQEWKAGGGEAASSGLAAAQSPPTPKREKPAAGLAAAQNPLTPHQEKLLNIEKTLPTDPLERFHALSSAANAAFKAGELDQAQNYADELLSDANRYRTDWDYGNAIFFGNLVNGRVALKRDDNISLADSYLIAAGHTPGSPQLNSFGPSMGLAKDLLARGERDTVLEFLDLCRQFWKTGHDRLDTWSGTIRDGGVPDFGPNLRYD